MSTTDQHLYQELSAKLDFCRQTKSNLVIITLPGFGSSHLLQIYRSLHPPTTYLTQPQQPLADFNLLDLNADVNPHFITLVDAYFNQAQLNQKFALVVNSPAILKSPAYQNSLFSRHLHVTFYLGTRSLPDTTSIIQEINPSSSPAQIKQIFQLSNGISRIVKHLATNLHLLDLTPAQILLQPDTLPILQPLFNAINTTDQPTLDKFGLNLNTGLLSLYTPDRPVNLDIAINSDLSFSENNLPSPARLIKIEKDILEVMLINHGFITREQVSDIKWGENKYDEFSDLAIGKTIRRLAHKLNHHHIKTIPKVGYTLLPRNE